MNLEKLGSLEMVYFAKFLMFPNLHPPYFHYKIPFCSRQDSSGRSSWEVTETPPTEDDFKVVNGRNGKQNLANKLFHTKDTGLERSLKVWADRAEMDWSGGEQRSCKHWASRLKGNLFAFWLYAQALLLHSNTPTLQYAQRRWVCHTATDWPSLRTQ